MAIWLYAASQAKASDGDTLSLACHSGFIWRPFYNRNGNAIACVKQIQPGDTLLLGYRDGGFIRLLGRFRVGKPERSIDASPVFGIVPAGWRDEFQKYGYTANPRVNDLVGIFVEESEPISGRLPYTNQNALSKLDSVYPLPLGPEPQEQDSQRPSQVRLVDGRIERSGQPATSTEFPKSSFPIHDGVHIGIDVGGRCEKGFDLCVTEWVDGVLCRVHWKRLPHTTPLPPTHSLRAWSAMEIFQALPAQHRRPPPRSPPASGAN